MDNILYKEEKMDMIREVQRAISLRREQLTGEDEDLLMNCVDRTKKIMRYGSLVGAMATLLACLRLNPPYIFSRLVLTNSTVVYPGRYYIRRDGINFFVSCCVGVACGEIPSQIYIDSCLHRMLSLNASPIQGELASTLLKPEHSPWSQRILSKHLIPEVVYPDSSADEKPILRWRFKGESEINIKDSIIKSTPTNQVKAAAAVAASKSPFDPVPGVAESAEDEPTPNTPSRNF